MKKSLAILLLLGLSASIWAQEPCPPTPLPFLDNFDSPTLDTCWFWIREDTSLWSLTERPGWIRIVPDGDISGTQGSAKNILLRRVDDSNWRLETRLDGDPVNFPSAAGIIIYVDDGNYVNVLRSDSIGGDIRTHSETNSVAQFQDLHERWDPTFMRIDKIGTCYAVSASPDSMEYTVIAAWNRDLAVSGLLSVGLVPIGSPTSGFTADFDYFHVDPLRGTAVCRDVSGVWDSTGSPYYVTCDVTVPAGQTLEIRPGIQVLFTGYYKLNVFGNLQAIGTEEDSIVFTRAFPTEESKWRGILVTGSTDTSRFQFCRFSYGKAGNDEPEGGAINVVQSNIVVSHCRFSSNHAVVAGGAIFLRQVASASIYQCVFDGNSAEDQNGGAGAGAIECAACNNTRIEGCLFFSNSTATCGGAIVTDACSPVISHCSFIANTGQPGAAIYAYHASSPPTVINCIAWENYGIPLGWNWTAFDVTYSDIEGGYSGTGNIDVDPMFVDSTNGDFHLQEGSPCIDTGDPNSPLDPDSTRADMGAFYFPQPSLLVSPSSIDYGLLDLGTDSTVIISAYNQSIYPVVVDSIFHAVPDFVVDTTGLGGQVGPGETGYVAVRFEPSAVGTYNDTLIIVAEQVGDDTIRIPLSGEADVILPPVQDLVIQRGPLNGIQLRWPPVTETISGQPITADYIIYGATSLEGEFQPFGFTSDTTYVHPYILNSQSIYFYYVTAIPQGSVSLEQLQETLKSRSGE
jgi:hypothetical protein